MNSLQNRNRPVGIFDSGLGGLTVAASLRKIAADENMIYLGDTARVPYGDKSPETLCRFAVQDAAFLLQQNVKLVVAACNTVSSVALDELKKFCAPLPVIGVIEPGIRAVLKSGVQRLLVIGTRRTIASKAYPDGIHAVNPDLLVESIATPLLVPLAEEGITSGPVAEQVLELYLAKYRKNPPEAILLACTHYPLFREALNRFFDGKTQIIDSATACAEFTADFLQKQNLTANRAPQNTTAKIFVTDYPESFNIHAERFFGMSVGKAEKIVLEKPDPEC